MDGYDYKYMDELFLDNYKMMDALALCNDSELQVAEADNAVVLPCRDINGKKCAGVVDAEGKYIELSGFEALSPVDSWGGSYEIPEDIKTVDESVVYFGRFWRHWGHFLMDMVSRLWYVLEVKPDIKIVYDSKQEITGVYMELMKLLGISEAQLIRIEAPTRFTKVVVPECSHKPGISCNQRYKRIFDVAAECALKLEGEGEYSGKKLYFTRCQLKLRLPYEVGEADFEKLFAANGYEIIAPEKHSLVEQIAMIRQADRIACVAGTLPHNMMFARDGMELTIIRKTNKPNYRQVSVNQIRELKVTNIDAHISLKPVGPDGPFILDVNSNVERYIKERGMIFKCSKLAGWFKRKGRLLWYIPVYIVRNRGKNRQVPIFDGKEFTTTDTAKKDLFRFYIKRI